MEQTQKAAKSSVKAKVQKLGSTLSSMVMPNIGALIAWGVLTALFIPDGYLPNEAFATMVGRRESDCWRPRGRGWGDRDDGGHRRNRYPNAIGCDDHGSFRRLGHQEI